MAGSIKSIKNSIDKSGIEHTTFRLLLQCLNQLCHYMSPCNHIVFLKMAGLLETWPNVEVYIVIQFVHVKDVIPLEILHQLEEMHVISQKYINIEECL